MSHYTQKTGRMMTSSFSQAAHHVDGCEEAVNFWIERSFYVDAVSQLSCKGLDKVHKKHPR